MEATDRSGPLSRYRVLELGSTASGPFCGRLFADFGAEVIKVEPAGGDPVRSMGAQAKGKSLYAASIFRNKSLISVDLRTQEGQELIKRLVKKCDVVIENFRPGGMEKWGLGYEELRQIKPKLVMVRISGYGQSGPYSKRPGYGVVCEAVGGLRHLIGDPDRPPARVSMPLTDYLAGLYGFSGGVMALLHAASTGVGQYVDAALYESAFSFMEQHIAAYQQLGLVAKRTGAGFGGSPNNLYPSKDKLYIHITAHSDAVFKRLSLKIGVGSLHLDARFSTVLNRSKNREFLDPLLGAWTSKFTLAELESILEDINVPASKIFTLEDIFRDPHYSARKAIVEVEDDDLGPVALAAVVPRLSETPGAIRHSGRRVGADTSDILKELTGLNDEEITRLNDAGIIYCAPKQATNISETTGRS